MEAAIQRFSHRLLHPLPLPLVSNSTRIHISKRPSFHPTLVSQRSYVRRAGWLLGIGEKKQKQMLPEIVKAGDPVLHEPAQEVKAEEIGSDRVQKIIDDMVKVMRMAPGVGLAAPQIGIPLQDIIARYHRMQGTPALWHSGTKYAGIATKTRSIHNARAEHSVEPANGISATVNEISRLLSDYRNPSHDLESSLAQFSTVISTNLVEQVLKRCKNLGFSAHRFFNWTKTLPDFQPSFKSYHILIDVLGSSKQFPFLWDFLIEIRDSGCCEICPKIFWIIFWSYSRANLPNDAVRAFNRMVEFGVEPSSNDLDQLLYALCKRKHVKEAKLYFDQVKLEIDPSVKTYSILIRGLGDINDCENARKLFEEMIERGLLVDVPAYNSLFAAMCKGGEMGEAYKLFSEMGPKRLEPDACTYATFICAFCEANDLHSAFRMLDRMKRYELTPNAYTYNYVIKKLCAESKVDEAYQLMAEMMETGVNPDIWSYKTILAYHCDHSEVNKALKLVSLMEKGNCVADRNTYNMVLKLLIRVGRFDRMEVLWQHMGDGGFYPSVSTYSVMVHGLCRKKGKLKDACKYFEMMIDEGIPPYHNTVEMLRNKLMGFGLLNIIQILSDKMERSTSCTILELASVMRGKKVHSQRRPEETEWESDSDS